MDITLNRRRSIAASVAVIALAGTITACGNSSSPVSDGGGTKGGTLKVLQGTPAESLDPSLSYSTQSYEQLYLVYTPLLQYAAKNGEAGNQLVPGLAKALPTISKDRRTYSLTLRQGLKYSDGTPVKASDVTFAIKRALKLNWGGAAFFTDNIEGADAYNQGKADSIAGITTDDATGAIAFHLVRPFGAFENVLAFVPAAPLPQTTPIKEQSNDPPPGVGPYKYAGITPNSDYRLVKNPSFAGFGIDGVPNGFVDRIDIKIQSNLNQAAESVLSNEADVYDPSDSLPAGLLQRIRAQAKGRFQSVPFPGTNFFFMNTRVKPFSDPAVRQAVVRATDRTALVRLSAGQTLPACYYLAPPITGSQPPPCGDIDPTKPPSAEVVASAKQTIAQRGYAGSKVTVWTSNATPQRQYGDYYADLLNDLGFKANLKAVQDAAYFDTVENQSLGAQTGFNSWFEDFPHPSNFYAILRASSIYPKHNQNLANVDDPRIERDAGRLDQVPSQDLGSVEADWKSLDKYVFDQGYLDVFSHKAAPKFFSDRVDFDNAVLHPVNFMLYNTLQLKR